MKAHRAEAQHLADIQRRLAALQQVSAEPAAAGDGAGAGGDGPTPLSREQEEMLSQLLGCIRQCATSNVDAAPAQERPLSARIAPVQAIFEPPRWADGGGFAMGPADGDEGEAGEMAGVVEDVVID
eukprot:1003844-Prymnesium_polylepis.1